MKYSKLSRQDLLSKVNEIENELKSYVSNVDERYRVFFDRNLAGIYRTKLDGEVLDCNDAMAQIMGYDSREELIGKNAKVLYRDLKDRESHLELVQKHKFIKNRKIPLIKKDGALIWVSISTSEIINPKTKKTEYLEGTMIDITELVVTEEKLKRSEENYKKMLDESPYGVLIHHGGLIMYFNKRACEILNTDFSRQRSVSGVFPEDVLRGRRARQDRVVHFDHVEVRTGDKVSHLDLYMKEVLFGNEVMTELSFLDIRERIELEEERIKSSVFKSLSDNLKKEIREKEKVEKELMLSLSLNEKQSAKLKAIFESSSHLMWTMDKKYRLTSFNSRLAKAFHVAYKIMPAIFDRPLHDYSAIPQNERKRWKEAHDQVIAGKRMNFIFEIKGLKGRQVFLSVFLDPIFDDKGTISETSGIAHDITDKFIAESKVSDSLREKEMLIKEIHHRVKNNLQVISSIFNLQSAFTDEERIREMLRESQNRIKSMAYIHESLYKSSHLGFIDFDQYVKELSKNLIHSYADRDSNISLLSETESVLLGIDQAIPCGLIVNEVVSNSLKHAFVGRKHGIIGIQLKRSNGTIKLKLTDNGVGIRENNFRVEGTSLGIQLIQTLVEQIHGEIAVDGKSGTAIEITFPAA